MVVLEWHIACTIVCKTLKPLLLQLSIPPSITATSSFLFIQLSHPYMFRWPFKLVFEVLPPLRQLGFHSFFASEVSFWP
uniref:Uncharacterized protein n=1 Tax=Malurus cyaneus samueli TaxID=2593467 RepID=A0A8C5T856_9PASS